MYLMWVKQCHLWKMVMTGGWCLLVLYSHECWLTSTRRMPRSQWPSQWPRVDECVPHGAESWAPWFSMFWVMGRRNFLGKKTNPGLVDSQLEKNICSSTLIRKKWRFPEIGVPLNHQFSWGVPWTKPSSDKGVPPWLWNPPDGQLYKGSNYLTPRAGSDFDKGDFRAIFDGEGTRNRDTTHKPSRKHHLSIHAINIYKPFP